MFIVSKLLQAATQPMFWVALWCLLALLLLGRRRRAALPMLWMGFAATALLGFKAPPDALLRALENRYAVPTDEQVAKHVGVIVLGGALGHPVSFMAHGQVPLNEAAERMSMSVALMRRHPGFTLVFSGGEGLLLTTGVTESRMARQFYAEQGLDMKRVLLEDGSRTTRENAQQVARVLGARCSEPWLLLTTASHMPRSVPEFEAVGCKVTPYPVDFRTGEHTAVHEYSLALSLVRWQTALHEWVGLAAYSLTR